MNWKQTCIRLCMLMCIFSRIEARTVEWGLPTFAQIYQSDGVTSIDSNSNFTFLLGSFADGFNPATAGLENWYANWHTFDQGFLDPTLNTFNNLVFMDANGRSNSTYADPDFDFRSQQLYLWVFNDPTFNPLEPTTRESALFTGVGDTWRLPAVGAPCCGEDNAPLKFFIADVTAAIIGNAYPGFDPDMEIIGDQVLGPQGSFEQRTGGHDIQTHSFTVIPETSVSILSLVSIMAMTLRRKRQA